MGILDRIDAVLAKHGAMTQYELENELYPSGRSHRHARGNSGGGTGGPPGCRMTVSRFIRLGGYPTDRSSADGGRRIVRPRVKS